MGRSVTYCTRRTDDLSDSCKNNRTLKARAEVSGGGLLGMLWHSKEDHSQDIGANKESRGGIQDGFKMNPGPVFLTTLLEGCAPDEGAAPRQRNAVCWKGRGELPA